MPKPLPKNCRFDKEQNGVTFTVEIDGREWRAFITAEAADKLYPGCEPVEEICSRSYVADLCAKLIRSGNTSEPLHISSVMLDE